MKWDGKNRAGEQVVDTSEIEFWNMTIENGTVYYVSHDKTPRKMVWCPAIDLERHLRRLQSLRA